MTYSPRPNIVYLHSHDTGRYVQPYGYAVPTPRLQQFAEEGVLFRKAFCVSPTCSPSRSALLTGAWPHCNGMTGLAHRGSKLNDYRQHLVHMLKPLGYHTALCGEQHIAANGELPAWQTIGYDESVALGDGSEGTHSIDKMDLARAHGAAAFIERQHEQPFFLSVGFFTPHRTSGAGFNAQASRTENRPYTRPPAHLPEAAPVRQDFADFTVAAERLDHYMATVLDAVDRAGLRDNTLVIITTDHGIAFPGMKCNLTDHGLGVMLMLRGPWLGNESQSNAGRVIDAMVTHMDLFPTLCDLLKVPHPAWLQGQSLLPLLTIKAPAIHDALFAEVNFHAAYEPMRAVRTERYKYIRRFDVRSHPVLANVDDSPTKEYLLNHDWARRGQEKEQLFDLILDPEECCNLALDPGLHHILEELRRRLEEWMQKTRDPLLAGRVIPWPGYTANSPDETSPNSNTVFVVK